MSFTDTSYPRLGMVDAANILLSFLREAWSALIGALVAFAVLAMLAQVLKVSSASVLGANLWVAESLSAVIAIYSMLLKSHPRGINPIDQI